MDLTTITIPKKNDRTLRVTVKDSAGTAIVITGCTFEFKVVPIAEESTIFSKTTASSAQIALTDPTNGILEIYITNTDTNIVEDTYRYGLQMTTTGAKSYTVMQGDFVIDDSYVI